MCEFYKIEHRPLTRENNEAICHELKSGDVIVL